MADPVELEFDWKNPNYDAIFTERGERLKRIRSTPGMLAGLKEHYKNHPADFVSDWGMTFDPRQAEIGLPTVMPFVLFQKQREFIEWTRDRWLAREDGLAEKSRDMGVSWLCCGFAVWMWLFHPGTVIGFGSRKEEYVDKIGDPKSLFWKIRQFVSLLPVEFRPEGYNEKVHAPHMRVLNPENGSAIVGEAGANIGRGNRTAIYFKDESAFYEQAEAIDAALSQTSNCKIDVSTPNGNGNPFYRKRHGGRIPVFTFKWQDDPRKDKDWYAKQKATLDPVIVAQEIDIDYDASVGDAWVSGALIEGAQNIGPASIAPVEPWIVSIDAAHYGDDESVIHSRRGRLNLPQITKNKLDGPQLAWLVQDHCENLTKAGGRIAAIVIELDGPGVSCYDTLRLGKWGQYVVGVHTGARVDDQRNYNVRARIARLAKEYLEDMPCSLSPDPEFKAQGAAMRYKYKDGLLLMESKKEYKARMGKSPDRWDAFVLSFCDISKVQNARNLPQRHGNKPASNAGY